MSSNKDPSSNNFYERWFFHNNPKLQLVDKVNSIEYIVGIAPPNTKETDIGWQITKYIYKDRQVEKYPAQGGSTNLRWVDRLDVFDPDIPLDGSPYDIVLSNYTLIDGTGNGSLVALITTLSSDPLRTHTYTIIEDINNKFQVVGDELKLIDTVNLVDGSYTIKVQTKDDLDRTFEQLLYLVVIPVPEFTDTTSVVFNGLDQWMYAPLLGNMFATETKWSWSVWLDPSDPTINDGQGFFGIHADSNNYFSFGFQNGVLTLRHKDNGNAETSITWASDAGMSNYSLVMDYDAANTAVQFNVYKNGVPQAQVTNSNPTYVTPIPTYLQAGDLWIGKDPSDPSQIQYLRMNDLSLWEKPLSIADAVEIYGTGTANDLFQHTNSAFLRGWWTFENGGADELSIYNAIVVNDGPSVYDPLLQHYVFINEHRLTDEILAGSTPIQLANGQYVVEVTTDNDQYLTEYIKYSAFQLRGFDLTQSDKFQEFIDEKFKRSKYNEVTHTGLGVIEILAYTVGVGLKSDMTKVQCSGGNRAIYTVEINSTVEGKSRAYYTDYNTTIDLDGLTVEDGDEVKVFADSQTNIAADYNATLTYREYLL